MITLSSQNAPPLRRSAALIEVITLDPETQHAEIQYKIDIEDRNSVASPRRHGANAVTLKRAITA